ncbi:MAG: GIN domain-containing protein [Bacteroidota bacterium]
MPGCQDAGECLESTGAFSTETRSLEPFNRIDLSDDIDLIIHPASQVHEVRISGGGSLLSDIETRVSAGTLYLRNNTRCNWVRSFKNTFTADVYCDSVTALWIEDAVGRVRMTDTLSVSRFSLDSYSSMGDYDLLINCSDAATLAIHNGPSNLKASGTCQNQYNYQTGYGKIDCSALNSEYVFLTNNGSNDSYVSVRKLLEAKIGHTGNVYYAGEPDSVISVIRGRGRLIPY